VAWRVLSMADFSPFPELLDPLRQLGEVVLLPPEEQVLRERIGEFDAYLAALQVQADRATLERAKRLRVIATPSTGLDHLDVEAMRDRGIELISLKFDTAFLDQITATAEMAWCLLLTVVRRLPWAFEAARRGDWARDRFRGHQLSGKTLGILGYGRLGRIVAQYGLGFRMRVLACDVRPVELAAGVERVELDRLLAESDVLSIHIHLTEENRGFIGAAAFERMKRGAVLINTSRGAIVDEAALLAALEDGRLLGAGLDVIEGEWRTDLQQHPLIGYANAHQNLVISPHLGGVTYESQRMAYGRTVGKLVDYLAGQDASAPPG
jgi:D-3-phosphoglycerate dehydrogenase / 2-oxoglutarate reductase